MAWESLAVKSGASSPVATVKTVSPSLVVCTGLIARAYASCTMADTFVAWAFVSVAFVMTQPMVVLPEKGLTALPASFRYRTGHILRRIRRIEHTLERLFRRKHAGRAG